MTKYFFAPVVTAVTLAVSLHGVAAQTIRPDAPSAGDRPVSVFAPAPDDTSRPNPVWFYTRGAAAPQIDPMVMERSIDIALGLGVLGSEVRPYRVGLPGPGYVGVIPAPIPDGWVVIRRCLERDTPTTVHPQGTCLVFEMRELTGNPHDIAWD